MPASPASRTTPPVPPTAASTAEHSAAMTSRRPTSMSAGTPQFWPGTPCRTHPASPARPASGRAPWIMGRDLGRSGSMRGRRCLGRNRHLRVWPGGPHNDLDVVVAPPGYFRHAEPLVQGLSAVVDGEHLKNQVLAVLPGFVDERADEAGPDAAALIAGEDLDAAQVDLGRTPLDVDHADVGSVGGDDLPAVRVEAAVLETTLALLIPPPGGGDVVAHGGLVQLEAELAVGGRDRAQLDGGHVAAYVFR